MFRTEIKIAPSLLKISLKDSILMIGSCFSSNIGELLQQYKINALINPFGTLFNPISINKLLSGSINKTGLSENGFDSLDELHFHYDLHSKYTSPIKSDLINNAKKAFRHTREHLLKSKWLVITWGTAIVYETVENNEIVANCHKSSPKKFTKRVLSETEILSDFENFISTLPNDLNIIITVSPVRHIKETIELNSVSKSLLRVVSHTLTEKYNNVHYFPSYEIMMDDLRDYRFYKSDMLHPNEDAVKYIWDKFISAYFDDNTLNFIKEWNKILNALNHKPFHPQSEKHQTFIKMMLNKIEEFSDQVDVTNERDYLKSILNN